jgi:endonuclease/exonuclease/phosphatase family metal-dependent hydrolase
MSIAGPDSETTVPPRRRRRRARRPHGCLYHLCGFLSLVLTAGAVFLAYVQAKLAHGPDWAYLATYGPQLVFVLPPLILAGLCLTLWKGRWVLYNLALAVVVLLVFVRPAGPHVPVRAKAEDRVRVVTWNIHEAYPSLQQLRGVVEELDPDILCLQESRRKVYNDLLAGAEVAHTREVTTLTRGRIKSQRPVRLGELPNYRYGIETEIQLPQGTVTVLNVHWVAVQSPVKLTRHMGGDRELYEKTKEMRALELDVSREWLRAAEGPHVLAGDFNTPPNAPEYRALERLATNAFAAAGRRFGFTFPRLKPLLRIDHIWVGGGVKVAACRAVPDGPSDHLPVVADIVLPQARP